LFTSAAALLACNEPNGLEAADIVVTPSSISLAQLQTQQLAVSVDDEAGTLLSWDW
jgi:hypothetical protein